MVDLKDIVPKMQIGSKMFKDSSFGRDFYNLQIISISDLHVYWCHVI